MLHFFCSISICICCSCAALQAMGVINCKEHQTSYLRFCSVFR
jgi:hypothetical protein